MLNEFYNLSNGIKIPKIAFGTWQIPNVQVISAVRTALDAGYRHIDTAVNYQNEQGVALGIKESGLNRKDIFITTKIPAEAKTAEEAKDMITQSLRNFDTDYIDLLLIHAPKPWDEHFRGSEKTYFGENIEVWKVMEEFYHAGKVRALGVSNFAQQDIENLIQHSEIPPTVNQIHTYIGHTPEEMLSYCMEKNILVMGFSPIATGELIQNTTLQAMAKKYNVSVPQLCIRYLLQRNIIPIPKSTHEEYIRQNANVDFVIDDEEMESLIHFPDTVESLAEKFERMINS